MIYTFNGSAKTITLPMGAVTLDLVDLHARWKDWVLLGNAASLQAFRAVGGEIPAIPLYLFLLNGWRIVPQSANHTLTVTNGVLDIEGLSGTDPFTYPVGYDIRTRMASPGIAIGYSTTGGTGPSAESIAAAVLAAISVPTAPVVFNGPSAPDIADVVLAVLQANQLPVDLRSIKGAPFIGDGTKANPWRPQL